MVNIKTDFLLSEGLFTLMAVDGVIIYQCEFNKDHYQDNLYEHYGVSFNANLERAVNKRKAEFLAGRFCCKKALAYFDIYDCEVAIGGNRAPLWPQGIQGAISHNSHHAMVAATKRTDSLGIGIDIESIMSTKTMNDIKEAILRDEEHHLLYVPDARAVVVCSLIFSIKETFFKAAYPSTGYYFDFDAITVDKIDYEAKKFYITVKQDLNPQIYSGMKFDGQFEFVDEQVISLMIL